MSLFIVLYRQDAESLRFRRRGQQNITVLFVIEFSNVDIFLK